MTQESDPRHKAHTVFLAALMVFSVFRDAISSAGEAAVAELSAGLTSAAAGRAETIIEVNDVASSGNEQTTTEVMV